MSAFLIQVDILISIISSALMPENENKANKLSETDYFVLKENELDYFNKEDNLISAVIELSTLQYQLNNSKKSYIKYNKKLFENIGQNLNLASWSGSKDEIFAAQAVSRTCFLGLCNGLIEGHDAAKIISQLIITLPPNRWFYSGSSGRVIYGTSFLLRSLLLLCKTNYRNHFNDYTNDVCERLLRKVEIKKENIFNFVGNESYNANLILEQMRFIISILEISSTYKDLRFLNAALKANDRVYNYFNRLKLSINSTNKNIQNILAAVYYTLGIHMQEDLYDAAFNGN